jgi:CBS domain-containing protein
MHARCLADFMTMMNPLTVGASTPLAECGRLHVREDMRYLPVVDSDGRYVGMLADCDVFAMVPFEESSTERALTAKDALRSDTLVAAPQESFVRTVHQMVVRRAEVVAVVKEDLLMGLFTDNDGVRIAASLLDGHVGAADLGQRPVRTVHMEVPAYTAWTLMLTDRIRHIVVVDDGHRPIGVLSLHDLAESGPVPSGGPTAIESIRRPLETISSLSSAKDAARRMADQRIGCLPVLDSGGHLAAILTRTDILRALVIEIDDGLGYRSIASALADSATER